MVIGTVEKRPQADHGGWWLPVALLQLALLQLQVHATAEQPSCRAWRASQGDERIRVGNRLGEAHYLTKTRRLQISPEEAPINLYRPSDLRRLCDER
jgi:hypothetical protein